MYRKFSNQISFLINHTAGDTLYRTSGELIDWYVGGSSVSQMANSIRRLTEIINSKQVIYILLLLNVIFQALVGLVGQKYCLSPSIM